LAAGIAAEAITTSAEAIAQTEVIAEAVEEVEQQIEVVEAEAEAIQEELDRVVKWQTELSNSIAAVVAGQQTQAEVNIKLLEAIKSLHEQITLRLIPVQDSGLLVNADDTNPIAPATSATPNDPAALSLPEQVAQAASESLSARQPRSWL
jgi:SMC interacting uncharacterized protein involved in chromosome segregation